MTGRRPTRSPHRAWLERSPYIPEEQVPLCLEPSAHHHAVHGVAARRADRPTTTTGPRPLRLNPGGGQGPIPPGRFDGTWPDDVVHARFPLFSLYAGRRRRSGSGTV